MSNDTIPSPKAGAYWQSSSDQLPAIATADLARSGSDEAIHMTTRGELLELIEPFHATLKQMSSELIVMRRELTQLRQQGHKTLSLHSAMALAVDGLIAHARDEERAPNLADLQGQLQAAIRDAQG